MSLKSTKGSPTKKKARMERQGNNHPLHRLNHVTYSTDVTNSNNNLPEDCVMISGLSPIPKQRESVANSLHKVHSAFVKTPTQLANEHDIATPVRNRVSLSMHGTQSHIANQYNRGIHVFGNSSKLLSSQVLSTNGGAFSGDTETELARGEGNEQQHQSRLDKEQMVRFDTLIVELLGP